MSIHGLAIGDLHLAKSNLGAMFDNADLMILGSVERVFKIALEQGIRFVVLLGDICDTQTLPDHVRTAFIRLLKRYDKRLDIRIILGNHDVAETAVHSLHTIEVLVELGFFKTVRVFTKHETEVYEGVTLEYMAWPAEEPLKRHSLCFAHYETAGSTRDNGHKIKTGHDKTFESGNQFVQGHLHTPHVNRNHWYVGTMAQKSFGERLPKGYGEFKARMTNGRLVLQKRHVSWQPPWTLANVVFNERHDVRDYPKFLKTLGPNPRVKLFVGEGVKIGDDFLLKHPEIVNRLDFAGDAELRQMQEEELELETQSIALSHEDVLPLQLKKQGATRQQIKRATTIIQGRPT